MNTDPNHNDQLSQNPININDFQQHLFSLFEKQGDDFKEVSDNFRKNYGQKEILKVISNYNWTNDKDKFQREFSLAVINGLYDGYKLFSKQNNEIEYFEKCIDFIDDFYCMYFTEEFDFNSDQVDIYQTLSSEARNKESLLNFIENKILLIGKPANIVTTDYFDKDSINNDLRNLSDSKSMLNNFLDQFFIRLIKSVSPKFIYTQLNPLMYTNNFSTFLSNKLILLFFHVLTQLNFEFKYFELIISNIGYLLKNEGSIYSKKINDEYYDNVFEDFDYNVNTHIRKLKVKELQFLKENFFGLVNLILFILKINKFNESNTDKDNFFESIFINYYNRNTKSRFYDIIEDIIINNIKPDYKNNDDVKIAKSYLVSLLVFDIVDFIYSNFYYVDEDFKTNQIVELDTDPFKLYNADLKPKGFQEFLQKLIRDLNLIYSNIYCNTEIFLAINDIHSQQQEAIVKLQEKEETWYVVYVPFNHVGFSSYCWVVWKQLLMNNLVNSVLEPSYIFDLFLPCIAALIKREQHFKYMGLDLLLSVTNLINDKDINSLKNIKNYNYFDVMKDIIKFIFAHDTPIPKRNFVAREYFEFIRIFTDE